MKTDQFDDEFRRKLLGLPADSDPGEVERVHIHVQTHLPTTQGIGWGKVFMYGGTGLLLIASLTYNFIQSYRNTHLQVSNDSLMQVRRLAGNMAKHDTVYITRSEQPTPSTGDERYGRLVDKPYKRNPTANVSEPESVPSVNAQTDNRTHQPALVNHRDGFLLPVDSTSLANKPVYNTATSIETSAARTPAEATAHRRIAQPKRLVSPSATGTVEEVANSVDRSPTSSFGNTAASSSVPRSAADNQQLGINQITRTKRQKPAEFQTKLTNETVIPAEGTTPLESITELNRQPVEALASRQLSQATSFARTLSSYRLATPPSTTANKSHQRWHLTLPSLSIPQAQYRLGGGLMAGPEDQVGGALLGEVAFHSRWSLQAGLRVLYSQGFHYRSDQDFDDHQDDDFRQVYAPQLPLTANIEDIQLASVIAQVPIQLAYHYPLSKQWRLRLGIGTDLDLWGRSIISYKYQGSGRSSERGLTTVEPSIRWFNNVTINPAVEWYRKRWLLRAGPFISPQLRSVSYKPDDFSWGANVQILYQFGK